MRVPQALLSQSGRRAGVRKKAEVRGTSDPRKITRVMSM